MDVSEEYLAKQLLKKAANFCAYQERTQQEVRQRLKLWEADATMSEEIIAWLVSENYINEERFAKTFAGSKFRVKRWGRAKIKHELKLRGLSAYCIEKGMAEIPNNDYDYTLKQLIEKKKPSLSTESPANRKQKIAHYLLAKGYESEQIWTTLSKLDV